MRNNFLFFCFVIFSTSLCAENISIQSKKITLDKNDQISIFEEEVSILTKDNYRINSDYAKYNKSLGQIKLKGNIKATDKKNNVVYSTDAEYDEVNQIFKSKDETKIITSENYVVEGSDIQINKKENVISSDQPTTITDKEGNKIILDNFKYSTNDNIFKSIGFAKMVDVKDNVYEFSQIYIDTKKKEMLGTDIKAFLNDENFKTNEKNKPRIFSNTMSISDKKSVFKKSVFTVCDYRENDKCPPWSIQASQMLHDNKKKTIYYNNAIIKIFDIPVFYLPRLSHPDPSVKRRSGFLPPSFSNTKNLGSSISLPYFIDLGSDKNFTLTSRLFSNENPFIMGEYHQAFKDSNLLADFSFTEGYRKTSSTKKPGQKSHFFSRFTKNFNFSDSSSSSLDINIQDVSNDKYFKLYKIKSDLVDYNNDNLENSLKFTHENNNLFFGLNASVYETLKDDYNDKFEYIYPDMTLDINLFNDKKFGSLDLTSNFIGHNYETNKTSKFLVNDFNWNLKDIKLNNGLESKLSAKIKNINYESKNIDFYKDEVTNELFGALGFLTKIDLEKKTSNFNHFLQPKVLFRYSPDHMRKETSGSRLNALNIFTLDRMGKNNNFESGTNATVGFDYSINDESDNEKFKISAGQIINKDENKNMPSVSSLDEKLSDLVGSAKFNFNESMSLNYNFNVDQNYSDINYNEIGASLINDAVKFDINFLQEKKHIGDQEYLKANFSLNNSSNSMLSFSTKRNLITNSSEFYDLSYEYINDCLKAGLVYRREFYNDSEIESENSLMFRITFIPFGGGDLPNMN